MAVDAYVIGFMKRSAYGMRFSDTARQIGETLAERAWFEDVNGNRMLERLMGVLEKYVNFELSSAIEFYEEFRADFLKFVAEMDEESAVRRVTWVKIKGIMEHLLGDATNFLEIVSTEATRLVEQIPRIRRQ